MAIIDQWSDLYDVQSSAANGILTCTITGPQTVTANSTRVNYGTIHVSGFSVYISGAATSSVVTVTLTSGDKTLYQGVIPSGSAIGTKLGEMINVPFKGQAGTDQVPSSAVLTATAGGAGCVLIGNLSGYIL